MSRASYLKAAPQAVDLLAGAVDLLAGAGDLLAGAVNRPGEVVSHRG